MKLIEDESFIELLINSDDYQKDYILKKVQNKYSEKSEKCIVSKGKN
ncbi:hypothetical protein [Clostridium sp.]|jgi:hypothetical protein|nr:hypothetical protein [Clostridium sp.]MDU1278833.1 hypothetical protein [Clostridium sp.]MDU2157833.1 hypothetical protein [Clostridium sp.]MDU7087550.1 hypothetical protein [Clostridium sp.]